MGNSPESDRDAWRPWSEGIALAAAVQFLTLCPPLVRRILTPREMGRSVGCFPLVGLGLGVLLAAGCWAARLLWPPPVTAALLVVGWALATGGLHLDGFLDTCDGLLGGRSPEERLRIMRDEHVGAFAVIGGALLLLVKYAALLTVLERGRELLLPPTLGRWAMALALVVFAYARPDGLGRALKENAGWGRLALGTMIAVVTCWFTAEWRGLSALCGAAMLTGILAWFVLRRLPGLTGDVYGAICELVEVQVLLTLAAEVPHAS